MDKKKKINISYNYKDSSNVTLFCGDRLDLINQIEKTSSKASLIVTSPPYNTGKEYEEVVTIDNYLEEQKRTIRACYSILAENGSICWQVGHFIEGSGRKKEAFPLDILLYPIFRDLGLKLRNRIVWCFGHGLHEKVRFSGRHETILWFTKSDDYIFNLDLIRIPQKYPGKRAYRGKNKGQLSGNPKGKNPSDVWNIPNVKANHIEKTEHPCQFPVALIERIILSMTKPGDLVVDPYLGVGTTSVAAIINNRRSAGSDLKKKYLNIAEKRIRKANEGTLRIRPLNKPVYSPSFTNRLAQIPEEWKNRE